MSILIEISENLQKGKSKLVKTLVQQALDEGCEPSAILNDALLAGMSIVGEKFKVGEVFVPANRHERRRRIENVHRQVGQGLVCRRREPLDAPHKRADENHNQDRQSRLKGNRQHLYHFRG